jgi:predicted DNA-binding transcriptional regulator YafY
MNASNDNDTVKMLRIVADLLAGNRHSRRTIATATGKSLATADRWIEHIAAALPGARRLREGKVTWLVHETRREVPSKAATLGACAAASLASVFEGTQHERNLKDARDYLLRLRGDSYGDVDRKFFFAPRGGEYALPEAGDALDTIVEAVLHSLPIAFTYPRSDGTVENAVVHPLTLVIFDHQFYALVRKEDLSLYCYRFARMKDVRLHPGSFEYPSKNEFDPRAVFSSVFGIHISGDAPAQEVEVVLHGPWARFALTHRWHPTQRVLSRADGSVAVTMRVRVDPEVESWVLGFGENAVVAKPDELRTTVARRLHAADAVYGPSKPRRLAKAKHSPKRDAPRPQRARSR